jgi:Zn-dependent protease
MKIARAFGINVYIHWTFWLAPLYVLWQGAGHETGLGIAFSLLLMAAVFVCVVLHEFGHALMGRHFGIGTRDITLYPIGGVARLEKLGNSPGQELAIALAGPAVNLVLAAVLAVISVLGIGVTQFAGLRPTLSLAQGFTPELFLVALTAINGLLFLFNLIPAFPMDGGRVLRALLAPSLGHLRATEIAARVGLGFAVLGMAAGAWSENFMWIPLGMFVLFAGQQEVAMLRYQEARRRQRQTLERMPLAQEVAQDVPAVAGFSGFTWDQRLGAWVAWRDGRPVALYSAPAE